MILIKKKKEPSEWTKYRLTPGVDYQAMPALVNALYEEQGYICAFCMRRIPCNDSGTNEDHHVEHLLSRKNHDDKKLDYSNMVVCCPGHIGDEDHCDRKKGEKDISFSPTDSNFIDTVSYSNDGKIKSSIELYDKELNEILNLNTKLLVHNRRSMIKEIASQFQSFTKAHKTLSKGLVNNLIHKYSNMRNTDGKLKYVEYCGVAIYYLQKKLNKMA